MGVQSGAVQPGDTITIVGAGPIGLAVLMTAQFYSPAESIVIDIDDIDVAATFDICQDVVAAGGHPANIGVHGKSVELKLENYGPITSRSPRA